MVDYDFAQVADASITFKITSESFNSFSQIGHEDL